MTWEIIGECIIGGIVAVKWYYEHKEKVKIKPDLNDPDYTDVLQEILDTIQKELGGFRVGYFAGQNGEKTLDGHSIKKLSMVTESNAEGIDNIITEMQSIPTIAFKRNIEALRNSERYIHTFESEMNDQLANFHRAYGVQTAYFFKVNNLKKKMWTGILCVSFEERKFELEDTQLGWLQFQVNKIESIISKL